MYVYIYIYKTTESNLLTFFLGKTWGIPGVTYSIVKVSKFLKFHGQAAAWDYFFAFVSPGLHMGSLKQISANLVQPFSQQ